MLHITPDTGAFLHFLVHLTQGRNLLEVGTSDGYSTLWLADAARSLRGRVTTLERNAWKIERARAHFDEAGLSEWITLEEGDALTYLSRAQGVFDFVFLDADRSNYLEYVPHLIRLLRPGGLWVTDNAVSHAHELADFFTQIEADLGWERSLVPVGKGEALVMKPLYG